MSEVPRWKIRTQFVGDDAWTHEARVEGPPTPGDSFVEVVPATAYEGAVTLLDDLADVLARVVGPESPERTEIEAVLLRAAEHANSPQSSEPQGSTGR